MCNSVKDCLPIAGDIQQRKSRRDDMIGSEETILTTLPCPAPGSGAAALKNNCPLPPRRTKPVDCSKRRRKKVPSQEINQRLILVVSRQKQRAGSFRCTPRIMCFSRVPWRVPHGIQRGCAAVSRAGVHETSSSGSHEQLRFLFTGSRKKKEWENGYMSLSKCGLKKNNNEINQLLPLVSASRQLRLCNTFWAVLWSHSRAGGRTHSRHFFGRDPLSSETRSKYKYKYGSEKWCCEWIFSKHINCFQWKNVFSFTDSFLLY